jgi:ADP-ribose pyrophosphatase
MVIVERDLPRRNGGTEARAFIEHPGSVVILPVLDDGRVVLIRNRRPAVGKTLWELPAGTRTPGEPAHISAARELEEETGYAAGKLRHLFGFFCAPGSSDERMESYEATGLTATSQRLDPTEQIDVHAVPVDEIHQMIRDGHIEDGKTISTFLHWRHIIPQEPPC